MTVDWELFDATIQRTIHPVALAPKQSRYYEFQSGWSLELFAGNLLRRSMKKMSHLLLTPQSLMQIHPRSSHLDIYSVDGMISSVMESVVALPCCMEGMLQNCLGVLSLDFVTQHYSSHLPKKLMMAIEACLPKQHCMPEPRKFDHLHPRKTHKASIHQGLNPNHVHSISASHQSHGMWPRRDAARPSSNYDEIDPSIWMWEIKGK